MIGPPKCPPERSPPEYPAAVLDFEKEQEARHEQAKREAAGAAAIAARRPILNRNTASNGAAKCLIKQRINAANTGRYHFQNGRTEESGRLMRWRRAIGPGARFSVWPA